MTIPATGAVSLSTIKTEFGGGAAVSLGDYYGVVSGVATSGAINMDSFRGKTFDVIDIVTASGTYAKRANQATYVHIFAVGAGGSGGSSDWDTAGFTTGVAAASGGGAGGVCHHRLAGASFTGNYSITIGVGGSGVTSAGDHFLAGNAGGATTVSGASTSLTANGGSGGEADEDSGSGTDTSTAAAASGGTASGGNQFNYTGGSSGQAQRVGDKSGACTGGGAPKFSASSYDSSASTSGATSGAKVSNKNDLPAVIQTYLSNRGQTLTLTNFDASDARYNATSGSTGSPTYGAGSGGATCSSGGNATGNGGNGVVLIIYEVV